MASVAPRALCSTLVLPAAALTSTGLSGEVLHFPIRTYLVHQRRAVARIAHSFSKSRI